jgi:CheY-like chemotaxis protein
VALILIIDDEYAIVETLAEVLSWRGHVVETAANGQLGLAAMRRTPPDVVLVDYMMPLLDGVQTLMAMRADAALATIPAIMISAVAESAMPGPRLWNAFLHKPFREPALAAALAKVLPPTPDSPSG